MDALSHLYKVFIVCPQLFQIGLGPQNNLLGKLEQFLQARFPSCRPTNSGRGRTGIHGNAASNRNTVRRRCR